MPRLSLIFCLGLVLVALFPMAAQAGNGDFKSETNTSCSLLRGIPFAMLYGENGLTLDGLFSDLSTKAEKLAAAATKSKNTKVADTYKAIKQSLDQAKNELTTDPVKNMHLFDILTNPEPASDSDLGKALAHLRVINGSAGGGIYAHFPTATGVDPDLVRSFAASDDDGGLGSIDFSQYCATPATPEFDEAGDPIEDEPTFDIDQLKLVMKARTAELLPQPNEIATILVADPAILEKLADGTIEMVGPSDLCCSYASHRCQSQPPGNPCYACGIYCCMATSYFCAP